MKITLDQIEQARQDEGLQVGDYLIRVLQDDNSGNSREWDNVTTMYCRHNKYKLGDFQIPENYQSGEDDDTDIDSEETFKYWLENITDMNKYTDKILAIRPLTLYDHSGLVMHIGTPTDRWDSMQVGWIVVTKKQADMIGITDRSEANLLKIMQSEVKIYNQDLSGDVWGYTIDKGTRCDSCKHLEYEEIDSCWGFYDDEGLLENINNTLEGQK